MPSQRRIPTGFAGWALACCFARLTTALKVSSAADNAAPAPAVVTFVKGGPSATAPPPPKPKPLAAPVDTGPPSLYDKNGLDWREGMCFSRERQSPINFDDHIKDPPHAILKYHYLPISNVMLQMQARSGLVFIDTSHIPIGAVIFNGEPYPLVRIDFHANSEHLFRGVRYAMEMQLVHRRIDNPMQSLVIAIPIWSETVPKAPPVPISLFLKRPLGPWFPPAPTETDYNSVLQQFLTVRPPTKEGEVVNVVIPFHKPLDLSYFVHNPLLPDTDTYIQYSGSLTTPPCSDSTTWFVRRKPMIASDGQTAAFADSIFRLTNTHGNFRAVMPVNMRHLNVYRAQWVMNPELGVKQLPLGPNARTDKEFQAEKLSDQAKDLSQDAVDYMSDFGKRLRRSARALEDDFNKMPPATTPCPSSLLPDQWDQAVLKMKESMAGIVHGVQSSVDKHMRRQTMKTHKKAAIEADKAREMTLSWTAAAGASPTMPAAMPPAAGGQPAALGGQTPARGPQAGPAGQAAAIAPRAGPGGPPTGALFKWEPFTPQQAPPSPLGPL